MGGISRLVGLRPIAYYIFRGAGESRLIGEPPPGPLYGRMGAGVAGGAATNSARPAGAYGDIRLRGAGGVLGQMDLGSVVWDISRKP